MKTLRVVFALLALAFGSTSWGQAGPFTKYGPVAGIQFNTGLTYVDTAATAAQVAATFCATSTTNFLRADGTCAVPGGSTVGANPTGSVGPTAVNGSATTFLRSDGAPPINLTAAFPWTGLHTFSNGVTGVIVNDSAAPTDTKNTQINVSTAGGFRVMSATDAAPTTGVTNAFAASRTGSAWNNITLGNSTDNPTYTFAGSGAMTGVGSGLTALNGTNIASGTISATVGGLGVVSPTAHGVLIAEGASAVSPLVMGADTLLRGTASADPVAVAINNCGSASTALSYSTSTHGFGCQTISVGGSGTVTSITAGGGLTGGTITSSGTIALDLTSGNTWTGTQIFSGTTFNAAPQFNLGYSSAGTTNGNIAGLLTNSNTGTAAQVQMNMGNNLGTDFSISLLGGNYTGAAPCGNCSSTGDAVAIKAGGAAATLGLAVVNREVVRLTGSAAGGFALHGGAVDFVAFGEALNNGTTCTISATADNFGVTSCTRTSTGLVTLNLSNTTGTNYVCTGSQVGAFGFVLQTGFSTTAPPMETSNAAGVATDANFTFVCF